MGIESIKRMYYSEIKPLLDELEGREFRANHKDRASAILEVSERFEKCMEDNDGVYRVHIRRRPTNCHP
jgi:hypothetical protein